MDVLAPFKNRSKGLPVKMQIIEDPGHDSPAETEACKKISDYAKSTGPQGWDAAVRVFSENGAAVVEAWVSPHFDDPVIVRMKKDEKPVWGFCDDPDHPETVPEWYAMKGPERFASKHHARQVVHLLRRDLPQLWGAIPSPQ